MDALYGIPVVGLLFQLIAYLVQVLPLIAPIIVVLATPIALGAMCGFMNERTGVVNIGIEGMMLASAFTGWTAAAVMTLVWPNETPIAGAFGATPALLFGLVVAIATGMLVSVAHAWLSISVRADQIISGTIINIVAVGITGYLNILISGKALQTAGSFRPWVPPKALTDLPYVGWLFDAFLNQGPIVLTMLIMAVVLQVLLFRSRWGLRTRAVGEHPKAAETLGVDVIRLRYRNVILGGIFAGLAGAWFTLEYGNSFQSGMTNGRGFIALAALIFGRYTPIGALGAALLFTSSEAVGTAIRFQPPAGQLAELGNLLSGVPSQVFSALPYLVTIIVLAGVVGRSLPPAADGKPYQRESAT
ncbi:MAG: ABC transporter permease [Chloroflexota bacterium]